MDLHKFRSSLNDSFSNLFRRIKIGIPYTLCVVQIREDGEAVVSEPREYLSLDSINVSDYIELAEKNHDVIWYKKQKDQFYYLKALNAPNRKGFIYIVILKVPLSDYESIPYYSGTLLDDEDWKQGVRRDSLFDYAVELLLKDCSGQINNNRLEGLINRAGENLVYAIASVRDKQNADELSLKKTVYDSIENEIYHIDMNMISSLSYEKAIVNGSLLITTPERIKDMPLTMKLHTPISIKNHKLIRKLLEISSRSRNQAKSNSESVFLVGTKAYVFGYLNAKDIVKIFNEATGPNDSDLSPRSYIRIAFHGIMHWEAMHYTGPMWETLFEYKAGRYQFKQSKFDEANFKKIMHSVFGKSPSAILNTITSAIDQRSGTMLVISGDALCEANRLSRCCIPIEPIDVSNMSEYITSIDGAVLLSDQGLCYAIGVILDGMHASKNGESIDSGARHNSAKRYIYGKDNCVIVIVSEDGGVTLLPDDVV